MQQREQHRHRLLLQPADVQRQRQAVDVGAQRLGQLAGHDDGAVRVVALALRFSKQTTEKTDQNAV